MADIGIGVSFFCLEDALKLKNNKKQLFHTFCAE
jgi:hypothetical protein